MSVGKNLQNIAPFQITYGNQPVHSKKPDSIVPVLQQNVELFAVVESVEEHPLVEPDAVPDHDVHLDYTAEISSSSNHEVEVKLELNADAAPYTKSPLEREKINRLVTVEEL